MDRAKASSPGLISSLEAMINTSVSAALDRRLGPASDPLSVQVDAVVTSELDRRFGLAGVDLDSHIEVSVARAVGQRFGPLGSAVNAQIVFGALQPSVQDSTLPRHTIVPQTAAKAPSSKAGDHIPLQDLPFVNELATAQLKRSNDNDGGQTINKMAIDLDSAPLQERYIDAVGARDVEQQDEMKTFKTQVVKVNPLGLRIKESQIVKAHAREDVLSAHSSLPTAKMPQPIRMIIDTDVQHLEASTIKRENSGEQVSTAALIRPYGNPKKYRSNYPRHMFAQGKALDYADRVMESSPDDSIEDNESLFVETEDTAQATSLFPKHRIADNIENIISPHIIDEHPESLSEKSYNTAEDGITISEMITPHSDGPSQLSKAKMVNTSEVKKANLYAPRKIDAPADGRPLSGTLSPPPRSHPRPNFAIVVSSSPTGNNVLLEEQREKFSRGLGGAPSQKTPHLEEASKASALRKRSRPVDSGQTSNTKAKERLFVEQGGIFEVRDKVEKRGVNKLEIAAEAVAESDESEAPRKRKRVKIIPPGYTEGPSIRFLKVFSQFGTRAKNRGYPRVVDLESFTNDSNKQSFTMADIVATILWNYEPQSLRAFLDIENNPSFSFIRKEGDKKKRDFAIERKQEPFGTKAIVRRFYCFLRMLRLTKSSRSATILGAQVFSGTSTTSTPLERVDVGIRFGTTRLVLCVPPWVRKRSRKQQWSSVATCFNKKSGFRMPEWRS